MTFKNLAKSTPTYEAIDDQELGRLSVCMETMLAEIDALDRQGILGDGYAATGETTLPASDGTYGVSVIFSTIR